MDKFEKGKCRHEFRDDMPLGLMINMVAHSNDNMIRERLDEIGAPKAFGGILMQIKHHEGAKQSDLAKHMNFSAPTISVTVQKLEESGYVERRPDENDQRQFRLWLTDNGKEMTRKIHETFCICENTLTKNFSQDEINTLRAILKKMYINMTEEKTNI